MFRKIKEVFLAVFIVLFILFIFKNTSFIGGSFKSSKRVIVIDAGHGGNDPGTIGASGTYEKDINLEIANKLKKRLRWSQYKVILTRDNDEYMDNLLRVELANEKMARLFISIHANAMENNNDTNGIQVLYYPDRESAAGDLNNSDLARIIQNSLIDRTGAIDKGIVVREDLIVLSQTKMPALIIETGFLTNEKEEKLLLTGRYQKKIVDSIVDGLEEYFALKDR